MFDAIKNFVADLANGDKQAGGFADQDLRVATAALLVHAAAIDGTMSDIERDKLRSLLQQRFELDDAAAGELIEQAAAAPMRRRSISIISPVCSTDRSTKTSGCA